MNETESSQTGQQHLYSDNRIRPSPTGFVSGLGACLIGGVLGIRVIIMIDPLMRSRNAVEVGGNLGGVVVLTLIASAIFKWGISRLRSTTVREAVQDLHDKSADKRQTAANALIRAKWMPTTETQQLDLLIAGEKWQKAVEVGSSGVTRVIDTLTWEGSFLPPKLDALEQSKSPLAIKPLIDILGHSASSGFRGNVVKALRQLTGKDFGKNMKEWLDWYEQTHNVLTPDRSEAQHTSPGDVANRAAPEK